MAIKRRANPGLVKVLDPLYAAENTANEEFHVQEHIFEKRCHYGPIAAFFDALTGHARCRRRKLLNRIVRFDATPTSKLDEVRTTDAVKVAIQNAYDRHAALLEAYEAALDDDAVKGDPKSFLLATMAAKHLDCILSVLESMSEQADELGSDFLQLCVKSLPKI